jgi:hypothetical protein
MNEWIEWMGGECPVPAGTAVEFRMREAGDDIRDDATSLRWAHDGRSSDIVAYRLHQAPQVARDKQVAGSHYKNMGVEPWDVVDTWPLEQRIGAYRHGALKYLMRMGSKDESAQEIAKGIHYMEKLLEVLKSQQ